MMIIWCALIRKNQFKTALFLFNRFCTNKLVRVYSLVLADYSTNQDSTNHAVVKMLYRIAVQLKMAPLLYQISVFRTFLAILSEPSAPRFKVRNKLLICFVSLFGYSIRIYRSFLVILSEVFSTWLKATPSCLWNFSSGRPPGTVMS